eukprot:scaffold407_cov251-Pinguiococcus_pyrenoidosus.AAC.8
MRKVRAAVEALSPSAVNGVALRGQWCRAVLKLLDKAFYYYTMRAFAKQSIEQLFTLVKHHRQYFSEDRRGELDELINAMDRKQKGLEAAPRSAARQLNSKAHPLRKRGAAILR